MNAVTRRRFFVLLAAAPVVGVTAREAAAAVGPPAFAHNPHRDAFNDLVIDVCIELLKSTRSLDAAMNSSPKKLRPLRRF